MSADQLDELPASEGRKNSGGGNLVPVLIAIVLFCPGTNRGCDDICDQNE